MTPLFEIENAYLGYDDHAVLKAVDVTMEKGAIYALLGPNGSGKTTFLRSLAGLLAPTSGRVLLSGESLYNKRAPASVARRRRVTLVAQTPTLFDASLSYNVAYGLKVRGVPGREIAECVNAAAEKVGLGALQNRNALQLSGGEAQRAAIARAIVLNTEILLLDEPTGNVDVENTRIIERIIQEVASETGATIIFSTHSRRQARRIADKAIHFDAGTLRVESPDHPAGYLWDK